MTPAPFRRLLGVSIWTGDDGYGTRHEADHLVDVGALDHPAPERSKHTAYDGFGADDLPRHDPAVRTRQEAAGAAPRPTCLVRELCEGGGDRRAVLDHQNVGSGHDW